MTDPDYLPGTSADAVRKATGRTWQGWFAALDDAGAADMDHKRIVAWLRDHAGLQHAWWQQNVTVEYEKARGKRAAVGETADAGFQVGAQRTLATTAERAWAWLTTRPGRDLWLGPIADLPLEKGRRFETEDGVSGEIRTIRPGTRLRLAWRPDDWERPSTVQVTVTSKGERCTVGFHHERLPDAETRLAMRERWTAVLGELQAWSDGG